MGNDNVQLVTTESCKNKLYAIILFEDFPPIVPTHTSTHTHTLAYIYVNMYNTPTQRNQWKWKILCSICVIFPQPPPPEISQQTIAHSTKKLHLLATHLLSTFECSSLCEIFTFFPDTFHNMASRLREEHHKRIYSYRNSRYYLLWARLSTRPRRNPE